MATLGLVCSLALAGCDDSTVLSPAPPPCEPVATEISMCATTCDSAGLSSRTLVPIEETSGPDGLSVAIFFASSYPSKVEPTLSSDAEAAVARLVADTDRTLAPCGITLRVERAEVLSVPPAMLTVLGTNPGSWGGLAPADVADADAFNHARGERLTSEARAFLDPIRASLPPGTIAIVIVDVVRYYAATVLATAPGISFPPVIFHDPGDVPARNAVFVAGFYAACGTLPSPLSARVVAHELGHMLLDTAVHSKEEDNLMSVTVGPKVSSAQCETMRRNTSRLYGAVPLVDPGPGG